MTQVYKGKMDNAKIFFTSSGYRLTKQKLEKSLAERDPVVVRLQAAREQGDLSENGAYKSARQELSRIDGNIRHYSRLVKNGVVSEPKDNANVAIGHYVTVVLDGKTYEYQIVGEYEADPLKGRISYKSPLGSAIIGSQVGKSEKYILPTGDKIVKIVKVTLSA